jgi:hypothetical protein
MYNNSEFCYYSSRVIKNRLRIDYSLDKEKITPLITIILCQ